MTSKNLTRYGAHTIATFVVLAAAALGIGFIFLNKLQTSSAELAIKTTLIPVEVADSFFERRRGLSGRTALAESTGMLFVFDKEGRHGIWMKDMQFSIDIVWIGGGQVVDIKEHAPHHTSAVSDAELPIYIPDSPAEFVLEVNAGFVAEHDIRIGDGVEIKRGGEVLIKKMRESASRFRQPIPEAVAEKRVEEERGYKYFIETLRYKPSRGSDFKIEGLLAQTDVYNRYLISYKRGDSVLSGVMTVPHGPTPKGGFPVLILNHGLIYPSIYYSGRGSRREKDFFGRNGYVTIHPDYRGYGGDNKHACSPTLSWTDAGCIHDFYVGYTFDIIAVVDALRQAQLSYVDLDRMGMWGHSMGGNMASRIAVLRPDIRAYVLFAPISADVEDNFYELPEYELSRIVEEYGIGSVARKLYDKMSPLTYFKDVEAPVQLHHGTADEDVPIEFSEKMYEALKKLGKPVEFYVYPDEPHEFIADWQLAAERSLQFFDRYVKNVSN